MINSFNKIIKYYEKSTKIHVQRKGTLFRRKMIWW